MSANPYQREEWEGQPIEWLSPAAVVPLGGPEDEEQIRALTVFLSPHWDLRRVAPIPVANEGNETCRALGAVHRLTAARRIVASVDDYRVPCIKVPCTHEEAELLLSLRDQELAERLTSMGQPAAAKASEPQYHRLPSSGQR